VNEPAPRDRARAIPGAEDVLRRTSDFLAAHDPATTPPQAFLAAQFDAGLAWVGFPEGDGGLGVDGRLQLAVDSALAAAAAPRPDMSRSILGIGMAAPTIAAHGTAAQRRRLLRPIFTGEEIWCQLFSEPGAGSDLATLATRAVRDGDEWVVNGQKVWTTLAHIADFAMLLTRTAPERPKHRGLTYFLLDMHAPGVDVRPLRQITGEAEFNEVYLTDVRVPDCARVCDEGDGWRVAMTTLSNERVAFGGGRSRGTGPIAAARRILEAGVDPTPVRRDQFMRLWIAAEAARLTNQRARQLREHGKAGPEGSVGKLAFAQLNQQISAFCVNTLGPEGMLYPHGYELRRPEQVSITSGDPRYLFLRSRANSIEGGTSEVLRNIVAERVLGLPAEPRTDKHLPWKEVPH